MSRRQGLEPDVNILQTLSKDLVDQKLKFISSCSDSIRYKLVEDLVRESLEESGRTVKQEQVILKEKLRDRGFSLEKTPQKEAVRGKKRESRKSISAKEQRRRHLFSVPKEEQCFQAFVPLHMLWLRYARLVVERSQISKKQDSLSSAELHAQGCLEWLFRMDFHGAVLTVIRSKSPQLIGSWGIVVQETENAFHLLEPSNKLILVPKQVSDFGCRIDKLCFILFGKALCMKSGERSVKKLKRKRSS